ncbi:MAG: LysR substrate-binding domain-containing protein [Streptosporangiaceae bacterium]
MPANHPHPTLTQLRALVAVDEHLHFGRAAAALYVSQSALSEALAALERALGVQLVERSTRRVLVTPTGRELAGRARDILAAVDDLTESARTAREPLSGTVRIGVIPTIGPYLLPQVLPELRRRLPRLRIQLREEKTDPLLDELVAGHVDALLMAVPAERLAGPPVRGVVEFPVYEEPFLLVAPEAHPLAGHRWLCQSVLAQHEVLLLDEGHCLREQALRVCRESGARGDDGLRSTSLSTLVQMVAGGFGVTLVPVTAVPVEVHPSDGLAVREFASPEPYRRVGLVWRATSARAAEFARLGKLLQEVIRAVGLPVRAIGTQAR